MCVCVCVCVCGWEGTSGPQWLYSSLNIQSLTVTGTALTAFVEARGWKATGDVVTVKNQEDQIKSKNIVENIPLKSKCFHVDCVYFLHFHERYTLFIPMIERIDTSAMPLYTVNFTSICQALDQC
jgi:hypothetical protein